MKMRLTTRCLILLVFPILLTLQNTEARIRFEATRSNQINMDTLVVNSHSFFRFVNSVVSGNPFGLQAYGQVPFNACHIEIKGRKLITYHTTKGREIRFISNPSCSQIVISRVLETSYQYNPKNLGPYENRQCIRSVEGIFSPLLEYYTIQYEEKTRPECKRCEEKERDRLNAIEKIQEKISRSCKGEQKKVLNFLNDLDQTVEDAFQAKQNQ